MRQLIKKDTKYLWSSEHEKALQRIITTMSNCETLAFFDVKAKTRLVTDASPTGLGAVLIQETSEGERIIS